MADRRLIPLSDGIYTVSELCRILGPRMTPRRVHYWLDTGLISGRPARRGGKGTPTLLTFRQLLEIKTVQHLRDEIKVPLSNVRAAYAWILDHVFEREEAIRFSRGPHNVIVAETPTGEQTVIPWEQGIFKTDPAELTEDISIARRAWLEKRLHVTEHVVADTHVLAGTPTVAGTRIETALIATFAEEGEYDDAVIDAVVATYPHLASGAVVDALEFEGIHRAA